MYPVHIEELQSARIDAANDLAEADALVRSLFTEGPASEYVDALTAAKTARAKLDDAELSLSAALTEWRREASEL